MIHQQKTIPWLVLGDLNEILYSHEKEGGNARPQRYIQAFHHAIENYEIDDIGFIGDPFTWHRGAMCSRLDRGLANASWNQLHSNAALVHLQYNHSNHRPLLLDTEFYTTPSNNPINRLRNFEEKWFREEGFCSVVEENWNSAANEQGVIDVMYRLKAMHAGLHAWDHRVLKKPKQQLREAQRDLEAVMRGPLTLENEREKYELAQLIEKLLEQEEIKWSQRSWANWLQNGDKNTSFSTILQLHGRRGTILKN